MKVFLIAATILFLPSMLSLRTKTVDQEQRSNQKVLTVEDFVKGQIDRGSGRESLTLMIQINQRLPPYKFHLIPDLTVSDSPGSDNPSHHVGWIEISEGESISILQKIDVRTKSGSSSFTKSFQAEDVNFDGFLDIAALYDFGAKWSILNYWLFDKRTGRFITSPLTQELKRISHSQMELDNNTKEIRFTHYVGVCPQNESYKILNGHLVLMEKEERICTMKGQKVFVKKRINGRMKLMKIRFIKNE